MNQAIALRRNHNFKRTAVGVHAGPISITFIMIVGLAIMAIFYLNQITKTNVYGYNLAKLQQKESELNEQKERLEVEAARLRSIAEIKKSEAVSKMVQTNSPTFAKN